MAINFNSFTEGTTAGGATPIQTNDYVVGFDAAVPGGERKWAITTLAQSVSSVMNAELVNTINNTGVSKIIAGSNVTITSTGAGGTGNVTINSTAAGGGGGTVTSVTGTAPISVANGTTTPAISLGTVPITSGGTGATTAAAARTNLGAGTGNGTVTSVTGTAPISVATGTTTPAISLGTVPITSGGTGATTAAAARTNLGAGTGDGTVTSVTGTAPISVANGTSTPAISIAAATTSAAGTMSSTDKTRLDDASATNGIVKCNGSGDFSAAVAGTDYLTSATLGSSPAAAKAWALFTDSPSFQEKTSHGISSITKTGAGNYVVNFSTAMVDTDYTFIGQVGAMQSTGSDGPDARYAVGFSYPTLGDSPVDKTTTSCRIRTVVNGLEDGSAAAQDVSFVIFR
jgi:hypothetical protein